jgi:hypothetical protein
MALAAFFEVRSGEDLERPSIRVGQVRCRTPETLFAARRGIKAINQPPPLGRGRSFDPNPGRCTGG